MPILDKNANVSTKRPVGYYSHLRMGEKHMGAILITNQIGVPLEFKYTEPVTATRLHKILYGSVLDRYLRETVIRDRLSREIRSQPEFFITDYEEKEFIGSVAGIEMMALQKANNNAAEGNGPFTRIREREAIVELEDGPVLRMAFSTGDDAVQQGMFTWIQEIARNMDVLEPMERIQIALKALCGEERKG